MEFLRPFTVLDGGLSTALELAGHDLDHDLWTARLLAEESRAPSSKPTSPTCGPAPRS